MGNCITASVCCPCTSTEHPEINLERVYRDATHENTPNYSYENIKKLVKVLRVIDGDTIDIALHHDETGKIFKHRIRLYGIDTPEMHPLLSHPNRTEEMAAAQQAKEALTRRFQENDNLVVALFYKFDKYGRLLATFYDKQGEDINQWLIAAGHAQAYFGKTKKKFAIPLMRIVCSSEPTCETIRKDENEEKTTHNKGEEE